MAEYIQAWQCIGCGKIEAPQLCIGVCRDRKVLFIGKGEIAVMMSNEEVGLLGDVLETPGFCDHSRIEMKFTPRNIIEAIANCPNQKMDFHYNSVPAKRSMVYIDGGSGYQTWVMGRSEDGGGS